MQGIDPSQPFVAEDGLEYEDLGDYLVGRPVECARNDVVRSLFVRIQLGGEDPAVWDEAAFNQYKYQTRDGDSRAANSLSWKFPQLHPRFARFLPQPSSPGGPEGAGCAGAVQAPADPVHAAD